MNWSAFQRATNARPFRLRAILQKGCNPVYNSVKGKRRISVIYGGIPICRFGRRRALNAGLF